MSKTFTSLVKFKKGQIVSLSWYSKLEKGLRIKNAYKSKLNPVVFGSFYEVFVPGEGHHNIFSLALKGMAIKPGNLLCQLNQQVPFVCTDIPVRDNTNG